MALCSSPIGARTVTGIAAKVNGRVITTNEVEYHLTPYREQLNAKMPRKGKLYYKFLGKARNEILENLIERELILSEFEKKTGRKSIPSRAIDEEIRRQIHELYNGNRKAFVKALHEAGLSQQQHYKETEKKLIVSAMRGQRFSNSLPPLPSEVKKEYYAYRRNLRDKSKDAISYHKIYVAKHDPNVPEATAESRLELAESLIKRLKKGESFEELAREYSADSFAEDGGKVEHMARVNLSPAFGAILMQVDTGEVIGPLEDGGGYMIVRVDKKHYGPSPSLSKVRPLIESRVRARKNKAKHDAWMRQLKRHAMIEKKL